MHFNLAEVPFSRYGAYLAFTQRPDGVYLRSVHGDAPRREICRIDVLHNGIVIDYSVAATPQSLRLQSAAGSVEICFAAPNEIRLRAVGLSGAGGVSGSSSINETSGIGLRLTFQPEIYDCAVAYRQGWAINSYSNRSQYALLALSGVLTMDAPWHSDRAAHLHADCVADAAGQCEILVSEFQSTWPHHQTEQRIDFDDCLRATHTEFKRWLDTMPAVPAAYSDSRELAAYITWSCVVAAEGLFKRPAMLMSKNWLTQVWSWDHCFNAMALSYRNPALAWDQFILPFDFQDQHGALPDAVNDKLVVWNFCKPPLHGWALQWLLRRTDAISERQLRALYTPLSRWTDWWLQRVDDDGVPQYYHGNDSGWDNCTLFDAGLPLASADLSALLVIQMETLADIARRLHKSRAAQRWQRRAENLLSILLRMFWRDDRFIVRRAVTAAASVADESDSLFLLLPIILGQRLPAPIRAKLIAGLRGGRFLTAHGLASESPASPNYQADGYWRGPIWAPATLLLVDGLRAYGETELAYEISRRFCATVAHSGMAENFDALSGAGLRDRAHTWTASVFLILAHEYLKK